MQSETPLTLLLSPLRAGRGQLERTRLATHQSKQGPGEDCTAWKTIRVTRPLPAQERLADLRFCQPALNVHELEAANRGTSRATDAEHWGVEYHFFRDDFFLRPFQDYLMLA